MWGRPVRGPVTLRITQPWQTSSRKRGTFRGVSELRPTVARWPSRSNPPIGRRGLPEHPRGAVPAHGGSVTGSPVRVNAAQLLPECHYSQHHRRRGSGGLPSCPRHGLQPAWVRDHDARGIAAVPGGCAVLLGRIGVVGLRCSTCRTDGPRWMTFWSRRWVRTCRIGVLAEMARGALRAPRVQAGSDATCGVGLLAYLLILVGDGLGDRRAGGGSVGSPRLLAPVRSVGSCVISR